MATKLLTCCCAAALLAACSPSVKSAKVMPMRPEDKRMTCADIALEMNEAQFLRQKAVENKGFRAGHILAPWRYVSNSSSASDAIEAADQRMEYLQQIHEIKDCDNAPTQEVQHHQRPPMHYGQSSHPGHPQAYAMQGQPYPTQQGYAPAPRGYAPAPYPPQGGYYQAGPQHYGLDYQPKPSYPAPAYAPYQPVAASHYGGYRYY